MFTIHQHRFLAFITIIKRLTHTSFKSSVAYVGATISSWLFALPDSQLWLYMWCNGNWYTHTIGMSSHVLCHYTFCTAFLQVKIEENLSPKFSISWNRVDKDVHCNDIGGHNRVHQLPCHLLCRTLSWVTTPFMTHRHTHARTHTHFVCVYLFLFFQINLYHK